VAHPSAGLSPLPGVSPGAGSTPAVGPDTGSPALGAPPGDLQVFGWSWPPEVVVPLALLAGLYSLGWWRLEA
jgi:hypothetical protein